MKRHLLHGALFGACVLTNVADASVSSSLQQPTLQEVAMPSDIERKIQQEFDQALARTDLSAQERTQLEELRAAGVRAVTITADSLSTGNTYLLGIYDRVNNILYMGSNQDSAAANNIIKAVAAFTDGQLPTITTIGIWPTSLSFTGGSPQTDTRVIQMTMGTNYLPLVAVENYPDIFQLSGANGNVINAGAEIPAGKTVYVSNAISDANTKAAQAVRTHPAGMVSANTDQGQFVILAVADGNPKNPTVVVNTQSGTVDPLREVLTQLIINKTPLIPVDRLVSRFVVGKLAASDDFRDTFSNVITSKGVSAGSPATVDVAATTAAVKAEVIDPTKDVLLKAQSVIGVDPDALAGASGLESSKVQAAAQVVSLFKDTDGTLNSDATQRTISLKIKDALKNVSSGQLPDDLTTGADGGLAGGLIWAIRTGIDDGVANNVRDAFVAGAQGVKTFFGTLKAADLKTLTNPIDIFAANAVGVNAVGSKLANDDNVAFIAGNDAKAINSRIIKAGEAAFTAVTLNDATGLGKTIVNNIFDITDPALIVLNSERLKLAAQENDTAGVVSKVVLTADPKTPNTLLGGTIAVLEGAFADAVRQYRYAGIKPDGTGLQAVTSDDDVATVLLKGAADAVANKFADVAVNALIAKVAADQVKAGVNAATDVLVDELSKNLVLTVIKDVNNDTGRVGQAAGAAATLGGADPLLAAVVAAVTGIANADVTGAGLITKDAIWAVGKVATTADDAANVAKGSLNDASSTADVTAAAINAALGWGIHNAIVGDAANDISVNLVTPVLTSLQTKFTNTSAPYIAIDNILASPGGDPARNALAAAVLAALKTGSANAAQAVGTAFTSNAASQSAVQTQVQAAPDFGALRGFDWSTATNKIDDIAKLNKTNAVADDAADAANALVAGNTYQDGVSASMQATVGYGIRHETMNSTAAVIKTGSTDVLTSLLTKGSVAGNDKVKNAVTAIKNNVERAVITKNSTGVTDSPVFEKLQGVIKESIKTATAQVTGAFTTSVLKNKNSETIKAASAALLDLTVGGGVETAFGVKSGQIDAIVALKDADKTVVKAATQAVAGLFTADSVQDAVVASVVADAGWGINQAIVSDEVPRSWQMTADGDEGINRGIAILAQNAAGTAFEQRDPNDVTKAVTQAFVLSDKLQAKDDGTPANVVAALFESGAAQPMDSALLDADNVVMHYDDQLQRVFIGLPNVGRGKKVGATLDKGVQPGNDKDGGVISVLVMRVDDKNAVQVAPVFANPANDKLAQDSKGLIGFYLPAGTADNLRASVKNLKTMHTSTNKTYLILNGGVGEYDPANASDLTKNLLPKVNSWVYALPLVDTDASGKAPQIIGQLGKINTTGSEQPFELRDGAADDAPAVDQTHVFTDFNAADEVPLIVGGDPRFLGDATNTAVAINYMEVVGDSVRVSTKDAVYQSTALFDAVGNITSWTKWQKVAGGAGVFGVNDTSGTMQFLSTDGTKVSTTADGQSANTAATSNNLTDVLKQVFPNGIYKIVNFGPDTVGFDPTANFNMMVAVGGDRVALIDTTAAATAGSFSVETGGGTGNVFVYGGSDLTDVDPLLATVNATDLAAIAPLTTAEVLRAAAADDLGYLFVGGIKGLARLEGAAGIGWVASDGNGATPLDSLLNTTFPGAVDGATYTFKAVDPAWNNKFVTGISGRNKKLCVATLANGVTETAEITDTQSAQLTGDDKNVTPISAVGVANDVVVVGGFSDRSLTADAIKSAVVIAGSNGLFVAKSDALDAAIKVDGIDSPLAPLALEYLSAQDLNLAQGELFVLAADRNGNQAKIYRFAVDAAAGSLADVLKPLQAYDATTKAPVSLDPIDLGVFTRSFSTDGAMIMTARGRTVSNTNLTDVIALEGADAAKSTSLVGQIDIGDASTTTMSFAPVKDLASGRWVVPGDFGARVVND